eukprot:7309175-Lingulodinium_polyedra.AAC.1
MAATTEAIHKFVTSSVGSFGGSGADPMSFLSMTPEGAQVFSVFGHFPGPGAQPRRRCCAGPWRRTPW